MRGQEAMSPLCYPIHQQALARTACRLPLVDGPSDQPQLLQYDLKVPCQRSGRAVWEFEQDLLKSCWWVQIAADHQLTTNAMCSRS